MPWDDTPPYEEVPYDDAAAAPYEEDEYFAPSPLPQASAPAPRQVPAPQQQPAPATAPKPVPQPAPATAQKPVPQPAPAPAPAPQPKAEPAPKPAPAPQQAAAQAPTDDEAAAIMSMLTDVFGEGVTMSTVAATSADTDPDE